MRRRRLLSVTGAVAGLLGMGALVMAGTGAQAQTSPGETVAAAVDAWNAEDAETFVSYFTDSGFMAVFGADPDDKVEFIEEDRATAGPIADYDVSRLKLEGGGFTAEVSLQFEAGFTLYQIWSFIEEEDGWKVDGAEVFAPEIPEGVPAVELMLQEYAFVYNDAAINAADGNFAFSVSNEGAEPHEVVVLGIETDDSLLDLLEASDPESEDLPAGLSFVSFGGVFPPGESGNVIFDQPLGAGRYGLVCFLPSPDGTPHAVLGMVSEFTVGSGPVDGGTGGGGITPPSTGDGGLLGSGASASWLMLAPLLALLAARGTMVARSKGATKA